MPGLEDDSAVVAVQQVVAQWESEIAEGRGQKRLVLRLGGCPQQCTVLPALELPLSCTFPSCAAASITLWVHVLGTHECTHWQYNGA
jgi:hypothetical protein